MIEPLLSPRDLERLRTALTDAGYTADGLRGALGLAGLAALARGDLDGVERLTRGGSAAETLARLFLLGRAEPESRVADALHPLDLSAARAADLLLPAAADTVRAGLDVRPY